jgi:hypothetical protein
MRYSRMCWMIFGDCVNKWVRWRKYGRRSQQCCRSNLADTVIRPIEDYDGRLRLDPIAFLPLASRILYCLPGAIFGVMVSLGGRCNYR